MSEAKARELVAECERTLPAMEEAYRKGGPFLLHVAARIIRDLLAARVPAPPAEPRERAINERSDAYELAAQVCESETVDADDTGSEEDRAYNLACEHCAKAIRKLKADAAPAAEPVAQPVDWTTPVPLSVEHEDGKHHLTAAGEALMDRALRRSVTRVAGVKRAAEPVAQPAPQAADYFGTPPPGGEPVAQQPPPHEAENCEGCGGSGDAVIYHGQGPHAEPEIIKCRDCEGTGLADPTIARPFTDECPGEGRGLGGIKPLYCICGRCAVCGFHKHVAAHGPAYGQPPGSKPYDHEFVPERAAKESK